MDAHEAREHLEAERVRLEHVRETFESERLRDESGEESVADLSHNKQHPADGGSDTFEREKDFSILEQVEAELRDVEIALRHLDDGTYGTCEACGKPIDDARLEAMPATRFCVADQARAEHELRTSAPHEIVDDERAGR